MTLGWDQIKTIANTLKEAGKIEQYQQILELQSQLLDMQNRLNNLENENRELKIKLETKEDLVYVKTKNSYWTKNEDGPFCSRCWDVNKITVRLKPGVNLSFHICPECKTQVQTDPNYRPPFTPKHVFDR